jgi:hypothetical protein
MFNSTKAKVARGMAWALTEGPRYGIDLERVDLARLTMASGQFCVLGQACLGPSANGFRHVARKLQRDGVDLESFMVDHGFDVAVWVIGPWRMSSKRRLAKLDAAWRKALIEYRINRDIIKTISGA